LLAAIRRFGADAVFGAIYPMFPVASVHPYAREKFTRDVGRPTGTPIPAGSPMRGMLGICNTILDRGRCFTDGDNEPFKPWLGFQGGEDTLFFRQLLQRGRKMVWCAEAVVRETIPAERLGEITCCAAPSTTARSQRRPGVPSIRRHGCGCSR